MPNARWSVDFVHDQLADGRRLRILNVVDDVTQECLAAVVDTSISGRRAARELAALVAHRGRPQPIVSDHGTAFTSNAVPAWTRRERIAWHLIAPPMASGPSSRSRRGHRQEPVQGQAAAGRHLRVQRPDAG